MSYCVRYQHIRKKSRREFVDIRSILTVLCFFLFLILVWSLWPEGKSAVEDVLSFLKPTMMVSAMNEMAEELQNGINLADTLENLFNNLTQSAHFGSD